MLFSPLLLLEVIRSLTRTWALPPPTTFPLSSTTPRFACVTIKASTHQQPRPPLLWCCCCNRNLQCLLGNRHECDGFYESSITSGTSVTSVSSSSWATEGGVVSCQSPGANLKGKSNQYTWCTYSTSYQLMHSIESVYSLCTLCVRALVWLTHKRPSLQHYTHRETQGDTWYVSY